jgi:hypothetical protein
MTQLLTSSSCNLLNLEGHHSNIAEKRKRERQLEKWESLFMSVCEHNAPAPGVTFLHIDEASIDRNQPILLDLLME